MKAVLIITYIDFWRQGAGHRSRLSSMICFLSNFVEITIAYLGQEVKTDQIKIEEEYPEVELVYLEKEKPLTIAQYGEQFKSIFGNRTFAYAIIEYIELSLFLNYLPESTLSILDTHDLVHKKVASFKSYKALYTGVSLTQDREYELYTYYDYVLMIQNNEYQLVRKEFGDKILLVPHAVQTNPRPIGGKVANIGFVGSEYHPNIYAIEWFIANVWSNVVKEYSGIRLNIYGRVCNKIEIDLLREKSDIELHGFVEDIGIIYKNNDIIINPVFFGGGLKIKNLEALGNGLPLITTRHGSQGIEDGANTAFLISDTAEGFRNHINQLISNRELREEIRSNAAIFAHEKFSPEKSYGPLVEILCS